jgi:hypothetical protein
MAASTVARKVAAKKIQQVARKQIAKQIAKKAAKKAFTKNPPLNNPESPDAPPALSDAPPLSNTSALSGATPLMLRSNNSNSPEAIANLLMNADVAAAAGKAVRSILTEPNVVAEINTALGKLPQDVINTDLAAFKTIMKTKQGTVERPPTEGGRRRRKTRKSRSSRRTRKIRTMNYYRKRGKTKQRKNY